LVRMAGKKGGKKAKKEKVEMLAVEKVGGEIEIGGLTAVL